MIGRTLMLFKFGSMQNGAEVSHRYPNVVVRQTANNRQRLCIAPAKGQRELLLALSRELSGPFALLVVMHTSRLGRSGRYQSRWLSIDDVELFLGEFADFLDNDARLDLWVRSQLDDALLVYDRHNILYAYGPLDRLEQLVQARGLSRGKFEIPAPHTHNYHAAYDGEEERLLGYFDWRNMPLRPEDKQFQQE